MEDSDLKDREKIRKILEDFIQENQELVKKNPELILLPTKVDFFYENPELLKLITKQPGSFKWYLNESIKSSSPGTASSSPISSSFRSHSPSSSASSPIGGGGYSGGGSGGGSGCFIATAVFGSSVSEEVKILKKFRDRYLLRDKAGKKLVSFYCRYSPGLAAFIEKHKMLKRIAGEGLSLIINLSKFLFKIKSEEY